MKFYEKVFREKQFQHILASGISAFLVIATIMDIEKFFKYLLNIEILHHQNSYKYVVLILWLLIGIYVSTEKRYLNIKFECENLPKESKRIYRTTTLSFIILVLFLFFL